MPPRNGLLIRPAGRAGARILFVAITASAVWIGGCHRQDPAKRGFPPTEVAVMTVAPETLPLTYDFPGGAQPYRRVEVRARVEGIIEERPFTEGALVKAGQVLYRLDRVRYEAAFRSAQARFENSKRTLDRLEPLLTQHAVAQQDVDNARFEFAAAQAARDEARKDLDDTEIRAGIDGRVGSTRLEVGSRVTGSGDLLTTIDRLDPIYVTFQPSSEQLLTWREDSASRALIEPGGGLIVRLVMPDGSVLPRAGKLDFVAPSLDAATGTQEFRAIFDNPERVLVPGQPVRVRLVGFSRRAALAIPERAVQMALGHQFVYVVGKGDTVQVRDVKPGLWSGRRWIIEQGLSPGDRVVVDGVQKVAPGRPVRPVAWDDSTAAGGKAGSGAMSVSPGEHKIGYFFIRRPVLAAVVSILITLLGVFAIRLLPVSRYPQLTPPAVQVSAVYPGATAQDVSEAVAAPIEEQLSGLQGLLYYSSANASDGSMNLNVYFDVSRPQDLAAVDVQNAVQVATPQLPEVVRQNGVTILKANSDILGVVALSSDDPRYDAAFLTNYLKLYVEDELKRVPGIGNATTFAGLEFSMLLQLDPDKMAALGITVSDVAAAVREQNATNPAGRLGREPAPPGTEMTLPVTTIGRLQTPAQFDSIIVRAKPGGEMVRLRDIGHAVLGSRNYDAAGRLNGRATAIELMYLRPGANSLHTRAAVAKRMDELARAFPKGVVYRIPFDTTPFVTASIEEVVKTLLEAMLLVALVVFLFLQSWRATLIPMLAVPVSVIGTFTGLLLLGLSINVLTLFALVLAIGIVVDDAIVVIENVERIMATEGVSARVAADRGIRQVAPALIAIVLSLVAVFVPVGFTGGVTGEMFKQFAITITIAVVLSGIVALTLTPALCALLLKDASESHTHGFFGGFNRGFARLTNGYVGVVDRVLGRPVAALAGLPLLLGLTLILWHHVPPAFVLTEDKGYFAVALQLPDGASLQRTDVVVKRVEGYLRQEPAVQNVVVLEGLDILSRSSQPNSAVLFVNVKPWDQRKSDESIDAITRRLSGRLFGMKDAIGFAFNLPEIPGLGTTSGVEGNLQARMGQPVSDFAAQVQSFTQAANQLPSAQGVLANFRANVPQLYVSVDRATAKQRGVQLADLFGTLQSLLSSLYINDFNLFGRTYRVQAEAQAPFRQSPADIGRLFVRGNNNAMIPVSSLTRTEFRAAPTLLSRFNGFNSALITATPKPGHSSGQVMRELDDLVRTRFGSQGLGMDYSGQSYQERASSGAAGLVLALGLVVVFLVLAAQYESWSLPFAVLLGVPIGILGALIGIWFRGQPADVYFQVGLITVVGLAAKNAILIVEFANTLRDQGVPVVQAALQAARERFRPILMTSLAFIFGVSPLLFATGAGAVSRRSIGTTVFFGMVMATAVGVFFIPLSFRAIRALADRGQSPRGGSAGPKP